jgi:hypothetical protein
VVDDGVAYAFELALHGVERPTETGGVAEELDDDGACTITHGGPPLLLV